MKRTRPVAAAAAESSWPASSHGSPNTKSDSLDSGVGSEHIRHSRLSPPGDISPLTSCSKADSDSDFAFSEEQRDKRLARYSARGAVCRPDEDQETSSSRSVRTPRSGAGQTRGTLPDVPFPDGGSGGERLSSDTRRVTSGSPHPGDTSTDESSVGYRPRARLQGGGRGVASAMATSSGRREGEKMRWAGPEDAEGSSNSRTSDTSSIREGDCSSVKSTTKRQPLLPGPRGASISRDPVTDAEGGRRGSRPSKQEEGAHPMDPAGLQLAISQESGNRRNGSNSAFNQGEDPANRNPRFLPPSQFGIEAVFQNGAKEGRLRLRWIVLENFKSYRGTHVVGPLTNSVGIVGPNGAGKSNLTDAVCFALGVNAKQLRCNRLVELINASETSSPLGTESSAGEDSNSFKERDKLQASVALHFFRLPGASTSLPPRIAFTRCINSTGESSYLLDGVVVPLAEYRQALRMHCSCSVHTLQAMLIFQGHIDALATKNPRGLAELVEEISGSAELSEAYEEAREAVRDAREESRKLVCRRTHLDQEFRGLKKQKVEAESYQREKRLQKQEEEELLLFRLFTAETLQAGERGIEDTAKQKQEEEQDKLRSLLVEAQTADRKRVEALLLAQKAKDALTASVRKSNELRGSYLAMMERLKFLEKQREEEDRRNALDETQKEELEQYEDALRKQLIRVAEQAQETERLIEKAEDKMDVLTPEQQKLYEELEEKWEEEHALRQQRIRGHEQQLKALRTSLDLLMREEREAQGSANTVQELHAEASAKAKEVSDALKRLLSQAHDAKQNLEEMRQLATTSAQQRQSLLRLQQELHTQLAQERSLQQDLRRIAQEREVCETLRNRISHAGIHGSALDCCKPSSKRLSLAVAAAMGSKANSLIVSSHAIALKCIEYLKTARLGCREFLPLDTLQRRRLQGGERTALSEFNEDDEDDGENDDEGGGVLLPPPPHDALPGGCRWAVDCVSFEESFRPVYEFLLSDCIIVPSLEIAQELKYGSSSSSSSSSGRSKRTSQSPLQKYRFVTLDGEKLQRGGVISFDVGGLTGRLAARWEAGEQHRLLERVERVKEQLQTLDNAEATNAERLRQRNEQFACLHRQCVQLQAKAKVWEAQAEAKDQRITELQKKVQALQESIVARKKEILVKQQKIDEMHCSLQQQQLKHFAPLDEMVGRQHVRLDQRRLQLGLQSRRAEAASLHAQEAHLKAELADCSDRLSQLKQKMKEGGSDQRWGEKRRARDDEQRLLRQLELTEKEVEDAEKKKDKNEEECKKLQEDLRRYEKDLLQIRERVDAVRSEQQRLAREEKAAIGRKKQREEDKLRILRQADQKGIRLPLTSGTWRGVRAVIYGDDDDDDQEESEESERERKEGDRTRRLGPETRSETRRRQWKFYRSSEMRHPRNEWSSDEGEEDEEGEKKDKKKEGKDEVEDDDEEEERGPIRPEEKMFEVDFAKLSPEKREFISSHKTAPSILSEAASSQEKILLARAARLRGLRPNLKVTEKEKKNREQVTALQQETVQCREKAKDAEQRLEHLRRERNVRFLTCFEHCRHAVNFFFRELTHLSMEALRWESSSSRSSSKQRKGGGEVKNEGRHHEIVPALPMGEGSAFLELEFDSHNVLGVEEEAFSCGVAFICVPPGKRVLPLHLLSGGERLVAALSLVLALLSFVPRIPFLLFDEVDAPLDPHRRQNLARTIKMISQRAGLQVLFVSLKDKMFSTAQTLVGVAKIPPSGLSRCFFLDLTPYQTKRSSLSHAPSSTSHSAIGDHERTPQYNRRRQYEEQPEGEQQQHASCLDRQGEETSISTMGKLSQSLSQTRRRISSSVAGLHEEDFYSSSVSEEKRRRGALVVKGEIEERRRGGTNADSSLERRKRQGADMTVAMGF